MAYLKAHPISPIFTYLHPFSHTFFCWTTVPASKQASQYLSRSVALDKTCLQAAKGVPLNLAALCAVLFNLKYASCQQRCLDLLFVPWGTVDVLIWDCEAPKRSKGQYMNYEVGSMDGAYTGEL